MSNNQKAKDAEIIEWTQQIYHDTHKVVYRYGEVLISRHCPNLMPDLDDLVQETYEELLRKRWLLYDHKNVTGWLMVTLKNKFSNSRRKWIIRRRRSAEVDDSAEVFYVHPNPVEAALFENDTEVLDIMRAAIGDEGKYNAFIDYHVHKVPIKVLAEARGISEDAMKMQLYRSRKLCRTILEDHGKLCIIFFLIPVTLMDLIT